MHAKIRSQWFGGLVACALLSAGQVAKADNQIENFKNTLRSVPAPEIPDRAASMVAQNVGPGSEALALAVVEAALDLSPATAPALAGAMARKAPALAPVIAAAAAEKQPKLAADIAKAPAASPPTHLP